MFAAGFPERQLDPERWRINLRVPMLAQMLAAMLAPISAIAIALGLICVLGVRLSHVVVQIPKPLLKLLGWSTL